MWIGEAIRAENYGLEEYPDGWGTLTYNRGIDRNNRWSYECVIGLGLYRSFSGCQICPFLGSE